MGSAFAHNLKTTEEKRYKQWAWAELARGTTIDRVKSRNRSLLMGRYRIFFS